MSWPQTDIAYLAGFVDGEGSITIFRSGRRDHLRFDIYNTNEAVLLWISHTFGGRVHRVGRPSKENWKQEFSWQTGHQQAAAILRACLPYLKVKRLQAEVFIAYAATSEGRRGKPIPENTAIQRAAFGSKIRALNSRGPRDDYPGAV